MRMAILNLFQSAHRQMKAKLNMPADDSSGQLNMVVPSQTPSPQKEEQE